MFIISIYFKPALSILPYNTRKKGKKKRLSHQPKPHKDVFWQGYGVTPTIGGCTVFSFSGGKPVFLRVCFDFSHKACDFVLCGNVNKSDSREVDVYLHIAVSA